MDLSWVLIISEELSSDGSFFMDFNWIFFVGSGGVFWMSCCR